MAGGREAILRGWMGPRHEVTGLLPLPRMTNALPAYCQSLTITGLSAVMFYFVLFFKLRIQHRGDISFAGVFFGDMDYNCNNSVHNLG